MVNFGVRKSITTNYMGSSKIFWKTMPTIEQREKVVPMRPEYPFGLILPALSLIVLVLILLIKENIPSIFLALQLPCVY